MPLYQIKYQHCGATWYDVWSCACDSECPICHHAIEATSWSELGIAPEESDMSTNSKEEEYVNNRGIVCPNCGSKDLHAARIMADGDGAFGPVSCNVCGSSWYDDYRLTGFSNLTVPGKPQIEGLDMSSYTRFDSEKAMQMPGISALKITFEVQCDQEEAHAFLRVWQMLDAMGALLEGDVGISHVAVNAEVVPDELPF